MESHWTALPALDAVTDARMHDREATRPAAILDALPAHIALLDAQGLIISVNEAWRRFTCANAIQGPGHEIGLNYLEICDSARGDDASDAHQVAAGIRSVLNGEGKTFSIEYPCHSPTEQRWFRLTVTPLADDRSNGVVVMHQDVTAGRQVEESLRASELRFRQMAEHIRDVFFLHNLDSSQIYYVSPAYERIWGRTCESLYVNPTSWADSIHPDDLDDVFTKFNAGRTTGFDYEFRIVRPDGEMRWIHVRGFPILDHAGTPYRTAGVASDITRRKQASDELRESERRFSDMLGNVDLVALMLDREARITYCNDYLLRLTGWRREEVIGQDWFERFIIPSDRDALKDVFAAQLADLPSAAHHENEILTRSGGRHLIHWNNTVLRSPGGEMIGTASIGDDTTRTEAKAALRESEERFRATFEQAATGITIVAVDGRWLRVNQRFLEILGYSRDELQDVRFQDITHADDLDQNLSLHRRLLANEIPSYSIEKRLRHKNGGYVWVNVTVSSVRAASGEPRYTVAIVQEIAQAKAAEAVLRESEERFRATFEQAAAGMGHATMAGRWVRVNQRLCDIVGYTREELLARTFQDITHPEDLAVDLRAQHRLVSGEVQSLSREKRYLHKSGSIVWIALTLSLARDPSGKPDYFIAVLQEITERKLLEQELFHAQRMEGVGQLAGGIAHDFNNLLTVIGGRAQLGLDRLTPSDPLRRDLDLIHKTADRAAMLTRQLLAFSRKQVLQPRVLDLNEQVRNSADLLKRIIGEDIELTFVSAPDSGRVRVDPGQLEQVIVNLVVNARDAMPDGGRITIETMNIDLGADYAARHVDVNAGAYVVLTVTDTGTGMSRETQARIFEPFFTTKGPGQGTGLGLATVYGIVKQSGGHVGVDSELGRGTAFKIYLPRTGDSPERAAAPAAGALPRGTETILLVEDEAEVRRLARDVLERLGYIVLEASAPADAMLIARRHVGIVDLLLTDVIMPRMSGRALAETIAAERPETKVLFMSGYTDDAIMRHGVLEPGIHFIEKPFLPRALATKVREVLDHAESA